MKKKLINTGLSVTSNRLKVLEAFSFYKKPIEIKQIRDYIKSIDRVTLFRIISVFESAHLIHRIDFVPGKVLYVLCFDDCKDDNHYHDHIHFLCKKCDDVSCVEIDNFPKVELKKYNLHNININASGICNKCYVN